MLSRWNDWDWDDFGFSAASPFESLDQLRREMDRLLLDYERGARWPGVAGPAERAPAFSMTDTGSALMLRAELPGMSEKDIELSVTADTLTLRGTRKADQPEGYTVHRKERATMEVARSFRLPTQVDPEKAQAVMKNGVLTLTLPKAAQAQPRQISVKAT